MEREIVRCSEGYWALVDDRGRLICRFKIGDDVKLKREPDEQCICSNVVATVKSVEFRALLTMPMKRYTTIEMESAYTFHQNISGIISMEVIRYED